MFGKLLTFEHLKTRRPAIDRLEGFHRGGACLYGCTLVPVQVNEAVLPAWLSAVGNRWTGTFKQLSGGVWR